MEEPFLCTWWLAYFFDNRLRRLFQKPEVILAPYVKEGMTVLDTGCGMGFCSIGMAKMVGNDGRVISVDLQQQMLDVLCRRATKAGVADRIQPQLADKDNINVSDKVDFALAMWMAHEVPDQERFLGQIKACMNDGARLMIVEPRGHVKEVDIDKTFEKAESLGFKLVERPKVGLSHAGVLEAAKQ